LVNDQHRFALQEPSIYRIHIQGVLNESWGDYFGGQVVSSPVEETDSVPATMLRTPPMDQAALVGLVNRLHGLGLRLLLVEHERSIEDHPQTT
jgi:hypothetical protein